MAPSHDICRLEHRGFHILGNIQFRLTEGDRVPALVFEMDGSEAVLPIASVFKLFEVEPGSADSETLRMVGSALRFVTCLRLGDPFPTEVISGKASWKPAPHHRDTAAMSLQLKLLNWLGTNSGEGPISKERLLSGDPAVKRLVNEAFHKAATALSLAGGAPAVASLVDGLTEELAYIEAMRERLLLRVQSLLHGLVQVERNGQRLPAARREIVRQVIRLVRTAAEEIGALFDLVDSQVSDVMGALRDLEGQCSVLGPNRDWLYCMCIAWEKELQPWNALPGGMLGDGSWGLLDDLYRFVAARFMKFEEWRKTDHGKVEKRERGSLVW